MALVFGERAVLGPSSLRCSFAPHSLYRFSRCLSIFGGGLVQDLAHHVCEALPLTGLPGGRVDGLIQLTLDLRP
jgi:hypothetical protein